MLLKKYRLFFGFVITVTTLIIAIQVYWNFQMYRTNKAQYIFNVERGFNKAVDSYYFQLGKSDVLYILDNSPNKKKDSLNATKFLDKNPLGKIMPLLKMMDTSKTLGFDQLVDSSQSTDGITFTTGKEAMDNKIMPNFKMNAVSWTIKKTRDSLDFTLLKHMTDSIFNMYEVKSNYNIIHYKGDTIIDKIVQIKEPINLMSHNTTSEYVPRGQKIELQYNNAEKQAFLKGVLGLMLSLALSLGIIGSILQLIKTIQKQKKLAELKDDFISNITHEFKTPIATVSAAIEALDTFGLDKNPEQVKRYLKTSSKQLKRLDFMVEKLLETSALEMDNIKLYNEPVDLITLCKDIFEKHKLLAKEKTMDFKTDLKHLEEKVDIFYFSSALSNLLDNAIKYGGSSITLKIMKKNGVLKLAVKDNGTSLDKSDSLFIFDKFSRKSKGNVHDIKGNGIGLYFTKKVIEKHGGNLSLELGKTTTTFTIIL